MAEPGVGIGVRTIYTKEGVNTKQTKIEEFDKDAVKTTAEPKVSESSAKDNSNIVRAGDEEKRMKEHCLACLRDFEECFPDLPDYSDFKNTVNTNIKASQGQYNVIKKEVLPVILKERLAYESWDAAKNAVAQNIEKLKGYIKSVETNGVFTYGKDNINNIYKVFMSDSYAKRFDEVGLGAEFNLAHNKFAKFYEERTQAIALYDKLKKSIVEMEELMSSTDAIVEKQKEKEFGISR